MKKFKLKSTLSLVVLSGLLISSVNAHPSMPLFEELNLSESQKHSLKAMRADSKENRSLIKAKRVEIKNLMQAGNIDAAAELAASMASDRVYKRSERMNEIKSILSPEQLATLKEGKGERTKHHAKNIFKKLRALDLTEAQKAQLKALKPQLKAGKEAAKAKRKEVINLAKAGNIDSAANLAADNARAMVYKRAELFQQLKGVLTEEQLQKLKNTKPKFRS